MCKCQSSLLGSQLHSTFTFHVRACVPSSVLWRLLGLNATGLRQLNTDQNTAEPQSRPNKSLGKKPETHHIQLKAQFMSSSVLPVSEKEALIKHSLGSDIQPGDWEKLPDYNWCTYFCQRKRFGNFDSESLNLSLNLDLTAGEKKDLDSSFSRATEDKGSRRERSAWWGSAWMQHPLSFLLPARPSCRFTVLPVCSALLCPQRVRLISQQTSDRVHEMPDGTFVPHLLQRPYLKIGHWLAVCPDCSQVPETKQKRKSRSLASRFPKETMK